MYRLKNIISSAEINELQKNKLLTEDNINKIINGYPSQYILGYVNFYGYKIKVNEHVLIPRYETENLVYQTINKLKKKDNLKILDLCTGSGCIAITLAKELKANVFASDISKEALNVAKDNSKFNNTKINFILSNMFENINEDNFDLIISNPPYIPNGNCLSATVMKEPHIALFSGQKGIDHITIILKNFKKYLKKGGLLAIEIHDTHNVDLLPILDELNLKYEFKTDLANKIRYLFIFNE